MKKETTLKTRIIILLEWVTPGQFRKFEEWWEPKKDKIFYRYAPNAGKLEVIPEPEMEAEASIFFNDLLKQNQPSPNAFFCVLSKAIKNACRSECLGDVKKLCDLLDYVTGEVAKTGNVPILTGKHKKAHELAVIYLVSYDR